MSGSLGYVNLSEGNQTVVWRSGVCPGVDTQQIDVYPGIDTGPKGSNFTFPD